VHSINVSGNSRWIFLLRLIKAVLTFQFTSAAIASRDRAPRTRVGQTLSTAQSNPADYELFAESLGAKPCSTCASVGLRTPLKSGRISRGHLHECVIVADLLPKEQAMW